MATTRGPAVIKRRQKSARAKKLFNKTFSLYRSRLSVLVAMYFRANQDIVRTKLLLGARHIKTVNELRTLADEIDWQWLEMLEAKKKKIFAAIEEDVRKNKDYNWMKKFPGLGPVTRAALLSKIDIDRLESPSAFWKVTMGSVGPENKVMKPVEGHKYFPKVRMALCHFTGQLSLMRKGTIWRNLYEQYHKRYKKAHPDYTKGHIHNMARRKMVQKWCIGLWKRWREEHGFSTTLGGDHRLQRNNNSHIGSAA